MSVSSVMNSWPLESAARLYSETQAFIGATEKELSRVVKVALVILKKESSEMREICLSLKVVSIVRKFTEMGGVAAMDKASVAFFAGIKASVVHASAFGACSVIYSVTERVLLKHREVWQYFNNGEYEDIKGALLSLIGLTTYLFSRVVIVISYAGNQFSLPILQRIATVLVVPNVIGLFIGGVAQGSLAATRIISTLAGKEWFVKEGMKEASKTTRLVADWLLLVEASCWIAEASLILAGCTNPLILLIAGTASLTLRLSHSYVNPFMKEYFPEEKRPIVAEQGLKKLLDALGRVRDECKKREARIAELRRAMLGKLDEERAALDQKVQLLEQRSCKELAEATSAVEMAEKTVQALLAQAS